MRHLLFSMIGLAMISGSVCNAQTATDVNEGSRLTKDATTGVYELAWWGKVERTYFIQQSDDLVTWTYMPVIEWKASASVTALNFTNVSGAPRSFFRLRFSDAATGGNPEAADFDGDHVGNMTELNQSTDPLGWTDVDGDLVPGDWEIFHGFNPASAADAVLDADADGLTNRAEFNHNSDPHVMDTDGDGFHDGYEVERSTDPALATSSPLINAQAQVAALAALAQDYVNVRAADGTIEVRDAAWSALVAAKAAVDAELAALLLNAVTPEALGGIEDAQNGANGGVAPAYGLPSTAILQYRWGNAGYTSTRRIIRYNRWMWDGESWGFVGLDHEEVEYIDNLGDWRDSDYQLGTTTSVEETMNVTFYPENWRDVGSEPLGATGYSTLGAEVGNGPLMPTGTGAFVGDTVLASEEATQPETYSKQWREYRLKRSDDGDQSVPLFMNFVSSDDTHEAFGETLSLPGDADESSAPLTCEAKPAEANPATPSTSAGASKKPIEIRPDDTMYDPTSGIGHIGDVVPSAKSTSTQKHFVTPKQEGGSNFAIFKAVGVDAADFEIVPPATEPRMKWTSGSEVTGDKTKRKVSRGATGHFVLRLESKDGGTDVVMNVWVVWAKGVFDKQYSIPHPVVLTPRGNGFSFYEPGRSRGVFTLEPLAMFQGKDTGADIPRLWGSPFKAAPGLPNDATNKQFPIRWDVSQRVRIKMIDTAPGTAAPSFDDTDFTLAEPGATELNGAGLPKASVKPLVDYPSDKVTSNDDRGVGASDVEDNDPYTVEPGPGGSAPIGQMVFSDRPSSPSIREKAGAKDEQIEWRNQFDMFVRLQLGESPSSAAWHRVSDEVGTEACLWQTIIKVKQKGQFSWTQGLEDTGCDVKGDNSGW